jgi:hypothetical protein
VVAFGSNGVHSGEILSRMGAEYSKNSHTARTAAD